MVSEAWSIRSSPTRSSPRCQDSVNPCRACARSPTTVKLREGQRSSSICHSASVSSWASSTTTWANGPAQRVRVGTRHRVVVEQSALEVAPAQHRHQVHVGVVGRDQVLDDLRHLLARGRRGGPLPTPSSRGTGIAEPLAGGVQQRQVGGRPGLRVRALQQPDLVRGRATGAHRRRYAGTDHRSPTRSVGSISGQARAEGVDEGRRAAPAPGGPAPPRRRVVGPRACPRGS